MFVSPSPPKLIPRLTLNLVGYCLKHWSEQQGSLEFLTCVEKILGWQTSWIKRELGRQWAELEQVDSPDN
jgi:hypothetical protein